jgi:hypothetical protein
VGRIAGKAGITAAVLAVSSSNRRSGGRWQVGRISNDYSVSFGDAFDLRLRVRQE